MNESSNPAGTLFEAALDAGPERLDRALAAALAPHFSRARVQALIAAGAVSLAGVVLSDPAARVRGGVYRLMAPAPAPAEPGPEDLPLAVLFEDEHLIVVDKPAGMSAHPAPGSPNGTLVNALLHRCGASLSGIGGVARPGIVHRLDKDTSGVMVAAKTDVVHRRLSAMFAAHELERAYLAVTRGAPRPPEGRLATRIGRSAVNRKKMAVLREGGREAATLYRVVESYGPGERPAASRVVCRLETGRTHQIRVHMAHLGSPCLGDPLYGTGAPVPEVRAAMAAAGLSRQALHAFLLAFVHPVTRQALRFETPPPADLQALQAELGQRLPRADRARAQAIWQRDQTS